MVPRNLTSGEAFIGSSTPRTIIPMIVHILMTVIPYSQFPYRRRLNKLMIMGIAMNADIQISARALWSGNQNFMIFSAATSWAGNPMAYANQYDHPQAKHYSR